MKHLICLLCLAFLGPCARAADALQPAVSATDLAAKLSSLQKDGSSYVRLKLEVNSTPKIALQLQIKQRRTSTATEVVYQVLWPKERMGESVLLRKVGNQAAAGTLFVPPDSVRTLTSSQLKDGLFGSDVTYADVLENFFAWENQAIVGTEIVDRVNCQILESKPGKGQNSGYAVVRSWVDARRFVPLRVEKYLSTGQLARRIETSRIVTDDLNRHVAANLAVSNPLKNSVTQMEGSRLKHDVNFTDREFTPEGIQEMTTPRSASE